MAKIKFGMIVTDMRGKLGGHVMSKNRSGAFARTKVTPTNPRTTSQMLSRSILSSVSSGWSNLTSAQRASWNNAVEDWMKTDIFGDLKKPSGKNLFSALNKNLLTGGLASILVAPPKTEIPYLSMSSTVVKIAGPLVTPNNLVVPAGFTLQISSTGALSAGTSFTDGKYRVIGYTPAGSIVPATVGTQYVAKFGSPVLGQNIYFQYKLIAIATGQAGVPERVKASTIA